MNVNKLDNLVSVISPAYNAEKCILNLIECVNNQTINVLEHIVIDDGSSDATLELLMSLANQYPHLKVISQKNQGAGPARNKGISLAKGRYIAFLDADDIWLESKLEAQISFMEKNQVEFSYGDYVEVNEGGHTILTKRRTPQNLSYRSLLKGCPIGCLTAVYNQELLSKIYMPNVRRGQDWGLWLAITRKGVEAHKYPGELAHYVVSKGSLSKNKFKKSLDILKIYRKEERLDLISSTYYFICHLAYVLRK